jgi:hypothetical protein
VRPRSLLTLAVAIAALLVGVWGGFAPQAGAQSPEYQVPPPSTSPPPYLTPIPIVRLVGTTTSTGARVKLLRVRSPRGSTVTVRCAGGRRKGCPFKSKSAKSPASKLVRFHKLERRFRAGAVIRVFVLKGNTIGKYTSFRIRRKKAPSRDDQCLSPADPFEPGECP